MRTKPARVAASIGVTLVVAAAASGAVGAVAWRLQASGLPQPRHANLVAARATAWLLQYRLVESSFRVGRGPLLHGSCLQGWFPTRFGVLRGTVLRLDDGTSILAIRTHRVDVEGARRPLSPRSILVELELAGCPRIIGPRLGELAQNRPGLRLHRATVDGEAALALRVPTRLSRIVVYLQPGTYRPTALSVRSGPLRGHSRIRLTRLTPARWRELVAGL